MTRPTCPCGRAPIHGRTHQCRLCWWDDLHANHPDEFPEIPTIGAPGLLVDHRVGRCAYVAPDVELEGENIRIHDMAAVGTRPFDFVRDGDQLKGFPRCGNLVIYDGVEVFPFANIDIGFLGTTIIESQTKIDHHVHVTSVENTGISVASDSVRSSPTDKSSAARRSR